MAWIESHEALEKHPKVLRLGITMHWSLDETLGKLHRFWWWCLNYAPTGDLQRIDPLVPAYNLGLSGDSAAQFFPNMMLCRLICRLSRSKYPWRIHDWPDYAGQYLRESKFKRTPEKYQKMIELYQHPCTCSVSKLSMDSHRTVKEQSSVPTNLPTNQPTNHTAEVRKASRQGRSVGVWDAYREAYHRRYGVDPVRNHKTNSLLCQVLDKLGAEEAPKVAAYYLTSNKHLYVSSRHAPDLLSRDAEGLRTEWITGAKPSDRPARSVAEILS